MYSYIRALLNGVLLIVYEEATVEDVVIIAIMAKVSIPAHAGNWTPVTEFASHIDGHLGQGPTRL